MPANTRRFWLSVKKHDCVLGEVRRVAHGKGTISALYLYEQSVPRDSVPTTVLPTARIKVIIGACSGIVRTICGKSLDWDEPPTESYICLMGHYQRGLREKNEDIHEPV